MAFSVFGECYVVYVIFKIKIITNSCENAGTTAKHAYANVLTFAELFTLGLAAVGSKQLHCGTANVVV